MKNLIKNYKILFVCILLIVLLVLLINLKNSRVNVDENKYLEKYESNQFIPVKITKSDMAVKYLNDYKNILMSDLERAYSLLNEGYKLKRFPKYEEFVEYIKDKYSLSFYGTTVDKFYVDIRDGVKLFYVYDSNGDVYIFKEFSIMNYEVYLDDYTINLD